MSDVFEQAKSRVLDRIQSPRDFLEFKLGAALKMEHRVLQMLDKLHDEVRSEDLREQFRHHADETRSQIENIEHSFSVLGTDADDKPCPTIEALDKESKANIKLANDQTRDLVILSGAAETEHHEIAVYECLITLAEHLGEDEIVRRLRENLEQEKHTLEEVKRAMREMVPASAGRR
jgi:ferritin-like metal-binding protein YciE